MAECEQELSERKVIPASEVISKIQKGEIIKDAIIKCDLSPVALNLPKVNGKFFITSKVSLINCRIDGRVDFDDAIFRETVKFSRSQLNGYIGFNSSQFDAEAYFLSTRFNKPAQFNGAQFNGATNFSHARFCCPAYFTGNVQFERDVEFGYSHFNKSVFFSKVKFKGNAFFKWAQFKEITFFGCNFHGEANFSESKFNEKAKFMEDSFNRLILKDSDFKILEIPWKDIKERLEYDGAAYQALVKNYKNLEWFDDADKCYYYYRTIKRDEHLEGKILKFIDRIIACWSYGYGVHLENPLILSLVIFALSILIFMYGFGLQEPLGSGIKAFFLSVFVFTSSPKTDPLTGWYALWGVIERIAGWLLMASFLVVLAKKNAQISHRIEPASRTLEVCRMVHRDGVLDNMR